VSSLYDVNAFVHVRSRKNDAIHNLSPWIGDPVELCHLPMNWNVSIPFKTRRLRRHVRVEAAGDGLLDDGLLFFVQQDDEPALVADETGYTRILEIKVTGNRPLLV